MTTPPSPPPHLVRNRISERVHIVRSVADPDDDPLGHAQGALLTLCNKRLYLHREIIDACALPVRTVNEGDLCATCQRLSRTSATASPWR